MTRISIIIPSLEMGEQLPRAVKSVLDSQISELECIVVRTKRSDSNGNTFAIDDHRLMFHICEDACNHAQLINAGLAKATGVVIGILSPDDFYESDTLNRALDEFEQGPDCKLLYGHVNAVDFDGRVIRRARTFTPTLKNLRERTCLHSSAFFFRRSTVETAGTYDESILYWPHYDFWLRMALAKIPFSYCPSLIANKCVHPKAPRVNHDLELAKAREAWDLTLKRLGEPSTRWAVLYGRCAAEKAEQSRTRTSGFDYVTLQSAFTELIPEGETNFGKWSRMLKIIRHHSVSEANRIRKRPRFALRFLPWKAGSRIQTNLGRRLFQLRFDEPYPCVLPATYFSNIELKNPPTIAIATPNLNQGSFIERTIRSVLDQNYPALEYVVQDGCSSDNSLEVIQRYETQLSSWESVRDNGQSQAINFGLSKTRGEIMAYLNSDDVLLPGSLAYVAKFFQENPKVDVIYGNRLLINEQDEVINHWVLPSHDSETLRWADYIPQETMFWRRRAWEAVGGCVDESFQFAMDWDLILRFQKAGMVFKHLPRFLGAFRITDSQKTSQLINSSGLREMNRLRLRELGFCPTDRQVSRKVRPYIRRHRYAERMYQISESISKLLSPYRTWKIELDASSYDSHAPRSVAA